ncbi:MAG: HAMP domain-containing histidine kinase [Lachnospiraceae bacterium]|nr:HAMP domain-containing histidine kinase [Lachnospiraceae bacterium]
MEKKTGSIFSLKRYIIFFLLIAFVVTCSFYLFLRNFDFTKEQIQQNAILTFLNIFFLSLLFCVIDGVQRNIMIKRPVNRILALTRELAKGNFKARIHKVSDIPGRNEFDLIADNINKLAEELSGIETLRSDFVSNVSHEIKTPLSVIGNYATLLQAPELGDEKRMEYAAAISGAVTRLSDLVSNILKLNKLENQQIYPEKTTYDLGEQLAECIVGFEEIWEEKQIRIETDLSDDLRITQDRELLSLIWNNLLSNAFKFTGAGGEVRIEARYATDADLPERDPNTAAKRKGDNLQDTRLILVRVSDTGCGMTEETGKHIFDKFFQGDTSHATKGNGLGLALVKRIIDICGGTITVRSRLGEGSTFTVFFNETET